MLTDLLIKNYALIEQLKMKPHESLNIITGETGAGKSIMLGAIGLLLGNRADLKVLFNTQEKCIVEASFLVWAYHLEALFEEADLDYADSCTIRREISPSGKSRAFINDTPVTLDTLKKIGTRLIDIHTQHDNLLLGDHLYQIEMVDAYAENKPQLDAYYQFYIRYSQTRRTYEKLKFDYESQQKEYDYHNFLLEELTKAELRAGEQAQLESELELLESSEEVKTKINQLLEFLSRSEPAVTDELRSQVNAIGQIANLSPTYQQLHERLKSCLIELNDVVGEFEKQEELIEHDPARIDEVQARLSLFFNLQQKHQVSTNEELLEIKADLEEKVERVNNFDQEVAHLEKELREIEAAMLEEAKKLSESRLRTMPDIEQELKRLLADLGMPNATVALTREQIPPSAEGIDKINLLFSANKGIAPLEISRVASGGEFSRLMLSIKYILARKMALPTIIFDEIDTGISGEIAIKMGKMFQTMSTKHQIIAISHLHQIAAKGDHHYFVYKDDSQERTISRIRQLDQDERIYEIAQMISGSKPSESALLSAREMLEP